MPGCFVRTCSTQNCCCHVCHAFLIVLLAGLRAGPSRSGLAPGTKHVHCTKGQDSAPLQGCQTRPRTNPPPAHRHPWSPWQPLAAATPASTNAAAAAPRSVDVSADNGATWVLADLTETHLGPGGKAWAWTKFQVPIEVREAPTPGPHPSWPPGWPWFS
jgi:hypothetical protein